jgi:DNA-binding MarR family transcriptional regulator
VTDSRTQDLGSDLTLYAARLVRLLRRERAQPPGMRVLSILDEAGALGIGQLAVVDQCSQPTMSGTVTGLVERGWVSKNPDPDDARASLVSLTAAGHDVLAEARAANGAVVAQRLAACGASIEDLACAVDLLRALLEPPADSRPDKETE